MGFPAGPPSAPAAVGPLVLRSFAGPAGERWGMLQAWLRTSTLRRSRLLPGPCRLWRMVRKRADGSGGSGHRYRG